MRKRADEEQARAAIEKVTGLTLIPEPDTRPGPTGDAIAWVDYRSEDGQHGFEVKRLVERDFLRTQTQIDREPFHASTVLTRLWDVVITAPTHFHLGGNWRKEKPPNIRGLAVQLEPHLAALERAGVTATRSDIDIEDSEQFIQVATAHLMLNRLTDDALMMSREPLARAGEEPGIRFVMSYGYTRRGADAFADRIQAWIELEGSPLENVVASLANGAWTHRHAVLVFDPSEPDFWTAAAERAGFVPSRSIDVGVSIELWCVIGRVVLHQDLEGVWSAHVLRNDHEGDGLTPVDEHDS